MHADPLQLLAAENPVPAARLTGAAGRPEAAALREHVLAAGGERPARGARRRRLAIGLAVACVAAAAAVVPAALLPDERIGASPVAAQALEDLATTAAEQPGIAWATTPGVQLYSRTHVLWSASSAGESGPFVALVPHTIETWVDRDGAGRRRDVPEAPVFLGDRDRALWVRDGNSLAAAPPEETRSNRLDWTFSYLPEGCADAACAVKIPVRELPTDVPSLGRLLHEYGADLATRDGQDPSGAAFREIAELLGAPTASPGLRATLFRVAAELRGVELIAPEAAPQLQPELELRAGRPIDLTDLTIVGFIHTDNGARIREEIVLDERTAAVVATRLVLLDRTYWIDAEPPAVIGYEVFDEIAWVNSASSHP